MPLQQAVTNIDNRFDQDDISNQLNLFNY